MYVRHMLVIDSHSQVAVALISHYLWQIKMLSTSSPSVAFRLRIPVTHGDRRQQVHPRPPFHASSLAVLQVTSVTQTDHTINMKTQKERDFYGTIDCHDCNKIDVEESTVYGKQVIGEKSLWLTSRNRDEHANG